MPDRLYCTLDEVINDLDKAGFKSWKEDDILDKIRAASDWIDRRWGWFVPVTEVRRFDGSGDYNLFVDPLISVTSLTNDGTSIASTQYLLYPRNKYWENGPYTRLTIDPDATQLNIWKLEEDTVVITGVWGKYSESVATGATVNNTTQISASGTSLLSDDGSKISPGMVLLIGTEQLLVTATEAATDSTADTNEAVDASEEEIDVDDGTQLNIGEVIKIDFEQMKVLDISTNTLLVVRGWNGTKKVTHTTSTNVFVYRTYTVVRGVNGTTAAAHLNGVAISRYIPPYDVNYLARQVASLMIRKAETGFAGKTGNVDLGEVFYHEEFPNNVVSRIERNYRIVRI